MKTSLNRPRSFRKPEFTFTLPDTTSHFTYLHSKRNAFDGHAPMSCHVSLSLVLPPVTPMLPNSLKASEQTASSYATYNIFFSQK